MPKRNNLTRKQDKCAQIFPLRGGAALASLLVIPKFSFARIQFGCAHALKTMFR
jgi:hypothetical protein